MKGEEVVAYLYGFLERLALTRVRNSKVKTVAEIFACLQEVFGMRASYTELETQLRERV